MAVPNLNSSPKHLTSKIEAIESSLQQTIYNFRDLVMEINLMHMETESVKKQIITQNEKCESKCCSGSEELKKVVQSKDTIIQLVASALTKLNETKNFTVLTEVFKILFGDSKSLESIEVKKEIDSDNIDLQRMSLVSPGKESPEEVMMGQDDSVSEIEGTPTGRHSPIIQSKKLKSSTPNGTISREKKKCPNNWSTPDKKSVKLTFPTPTRANTSTRLRQKRLNVVKLKPSITVDLTSLRPTQEKLPNTKKVEVIENDDTIFPSPTSDQTFAPIYKSIAKESPLNFKKPLSLKRAKTEYVQGIKSCDKAGDENVNITPEIIKLEQMRKGSDGLLSENNQTIDANESVSLLPQITKNVNNMEKQNYSPTKLPLVENVNFNNVQFDTESSISILRQDVKVTKMEPFEEPIRQKSQILEPLYKEPTVRKKAEKRALPGWSCDECKDFYGELYKNNPEMLEKKMDECSKHRGKHNPARPRTPTGFWNPRWDVPDDTEEFNRRNNV